MKWIKYTLKTTTEAVDLISAMLGELGIDGIEIEDNIPLSEQDRKKMFIDILPELPPDDGIACVSFYVEEGAEQEDIISKVQEGLEELSGFTSIGEGTIVVGETEEKDWINNWKQFFKPFRVDDTIVIKPTWETLEQSNPKDMVIEIDPGTAFGTGAHETTKLCILNLKKYMKAGDRLLDLGCGSGILSITGKKLGASYVIGTDIDENAIKVSGENTIQNKIETAVSYHAPGIDPEDDMEVFTVAPKGCGYFCCNVITEERSAKMLGNTYDIVVANILADVIIPLSAVAGGFLKEGGLFISSGIINTKAEAVKEVLLSNGFAIEEETKMGEWVSYVARHK